MQSGPPKKPKRTESHRARYHKQTLPNKPKIVTRGSSTKEKQQPISNETTSKESVEVITAEVCTSSRKYCKPLKDSNDSSEWNIADCDSSSAASLSVYPPTESVIQADSHRNRDPETHLTTQNNDGITPLVNCTVVDNSLMSETSGFTDCKTNAAPLESSQTTSISEAEWPPPPPALRQESIEDIEILGLGTKSPNPVVMQARQSTDRQQPIRDSNQRIAMNSDVLSRSSWVSDEGAMNLPVDERVRYLKINQESDNRGRKRQRAPLPPTKSEKYKPARPPPPMRSGTPVRKIKPAAPPTPAKQSQLRSKPTNRSTQHNKCWENSRTSCPPKGRSRSVPPVRPPPPNHSSITGRSRSSNVIRRSSRPVTRESRLPESRSQSAPRVSTLERESRRRAQSPSSLLPSHRGGCSLTSRVRYS